MSVEAKEFDVIVIGAGPAGLSAALHLACKGRSVMVSEKERQVGGLSKTVEYKGYRFDLGGHRFFTKSKEVDDLWRETLGGDFLVRPRSSRIYYRNKFFNYPLKPLNTLAGLGLFTSASIIASYLRSKFMPHKEERTLDEWVSNRFGEKLYRIFFKTYTEKLWGIPCNEIQAEWAAQRIKGLSFGTAIKNALLPGRNGKKIKTLIDEFNYPRLGPGMMYEGMAGKMVRAGGRLLLATEAVSINHDGDSMVQSVLMRGENGTESFAGDDFISSMPITELVKRMVPAPPQKVRDAANALTYRSFLVVNVILDCPNPFQDTWVYIHSPEIKMGRIQNFKSWSPYMVADPAKTALGLEYFCTEGDALWNTPDSALLQLGLDELDATKLGKASDFVDGFVVRVPKAYPVYDARYQANIKIIRDYLSRFRNLQPIGRYGMFKYNNMDHSILTGLYAAKNILGAKYDIWAVNADHEYHEEDKNAAKN